MPYVREAIAGHHFFDALLHRFMRRSYQLFCFRGHASYSNGHSGVAVPATKFDAEIETDNVALFKFAGSGNSVHDFVIDRCTKDRRVRRYPPGSIAEKRGVQPPLFQPFCNKFYWFFRKAINLYNSI